MMAERDYECLAGLHRRMPRQRLHFPHVNVTAVKYDIGMGTTTRYFAMRTLTSDAVFAGGSFIFVGIFVSFHTRSAVLGILGVLQVLLSFPMAFFLYRLVFQI